MHSQKIFYSQIEQAACAHFRITRGDLRCGDRSQESFRPRAIVVSLARRLTRLSYPQLGSKLNRDHTTIICADRRARKLLADSEDFRADFVAVEKILAEGPPPAVAPPDIDTREEAMAKAWRASLPRIPYTMQSGAEGSVA